METAWDGIKFAIYPKISQHAHADVAIIGGGLAGVISAYLAAEKSKKVILREKDKFGVHAVTMYTTAFITGIIDTDLESLISMYGKADTKLIIDSGMQAIDTLEAIIQKEKIDCEFMRCSAFCFASDPDQVEGLQQEYSIAKSLGLDVAWHDSDFLRFRNFGSLEYKNQAKFHPIKFMSQLLEACKSKGVEIYEKSPVKSVGDIKADQVLLATHKPIENPHTIFAKKGMYKSYILELEIPSGRIEEGIYWDSSNPYYYFRVDKRQSQDRMILGGADHRKELKIPKEKSFGNLFNFFQETFDFDIKEIRRWDGPIMEPSDGVALIGEYEPGRFLACAFSGNGMTYATITGLMFGDWIAGKPNKWSHLYDPKRKRKVFHYLKKAQDYTGEFFGGAVKSMIQSTHDRRRTKK